MDSVEKTIREIANELDVDKQKVYRFIKQHKIQEINPDDATANSVKYYDEAAVNMIKQAFSSRRAPSELFSAVEVLPYNDANTAFDTLRSDFETYQNDVDRPVYNEVHKKSHHEAFHKEEAAVIHKISNDEKQNEALQKNADLKDDNSIAASENNDGNASEQETQKTSTSEITNDAFLGIIEILQKELEVKNDQIKELNARLAEVSSALVAAQKTAQAAQALHAGTMQQQLLEENQNQSETNKESTNQPEGKKSWIRKIFGK